MIASFCGAAAALLRHQNKISTGAGLSFNEFPKLSYKITSTLNYTIRINQNIVNNKNANKTKTIT